VLRNTTDWLLATGAGLFDAFNARLPSALEQVASWTRTGKVNCPMGTCYVNTGGQPA